MADEFELSMSGIEETLAMLDQAPANIAKNAMAKSLAAASVPVVNALRVRTPSRNDLWNDETFSLIRSDGGTLKDAIQTEIVIDTQRRGGVAKIGFGKQGYIARFVEYGHRMVGHEPGKKLAKRGSVQPHPFMRPAAAASGEQAVEAFAETMQSAFAAKEIPNLTTAA